MASPSDCVTSEMRGFRELLVSTTDRTR